MVKAWSIKRELNDKASVVAFADAKTDVTAGMVIEGLPQGLELAYGSVIVTADADVAFLKSNGAWNWL